MTFGTMGPQMLPKSKRSSEWKKKQIDRMCNIADNYLAKNSNMSRKYQMIRGEFIYELYQDEPEIQDLVTALTQEFDMPKNLRHFDIIGQTINTLSGEWQEHPDNYSIRRVDEFGTNAYLRKKKQLMDQFINEQLRFEINRNLMEQGIDPTGQSIPENQREMYLQELEKQKKEMTPPEIEIYMRMSYKDFAEVWANAKMTRDKERFPYRIMERNEIEDMFTVCKCFRHFYVKGNLKYEETWNPVHTFYLISPDEYRIEKSELIGRKFYATLSDTIAKYSHRMTKTVLDKLTKMEDDMYSGGPSSSIGKISKTGYEYIPFNDYKEYMIQRENLGYSPGVELSDSEFSSLFGGTGFTYSNDPNLFEIVEGYFRMKERIGLLTYFDPETNVVVSTQVSTDFVIPPQIKVINKTPDDEPEVNTLIWSVQDRICDGIRIKGKNLDEPIYLGGDPIKFEPSITENRFELLMPVVGLLHNFRNADGASIVDIMTSDQICHNVVMNQGLQLLQRELGRFLILDPRMIPNFKDWGGEDGWNKFTEVAKVLGISFADTSPEKLRGANGGNQFPRMIDMDETQRIMGRFKLAAIFEDMAKRRIGMSDQRLGDIGSSETAEGIKQGISKSYNQTRSYYTDFSDYVKRCKKMSIVFNQYVDSKQSEITLPAGASEEEKYFIHISGDELSKANLDLIVSDNQEDYRRMSLMRNVFMNNPNVATDPLDIYAVINASSPVEMRKQFQKSKADRDAMQANQQQLEQQKLQEMKRAAEKAELWDKEKHYSKLQSEENQEYIRSFGRQMDNTKDNDGSGVPDILEFAKFNSDSSNKQQLVDIQRQKIELEKKKADDNMQQHQDYVKLEKEKIELGKLREKIKERVARINPG